MARIMMASDEKTRNIVIFDAETVKRDEEGILVASAPGSQPSS